MSGPPSASQRLIAFKRSPAMSQFSPLPISLALLNWRYRSCLLQDDPNGIDHPVCYFSRKFTKYQVKYSTIEKETLALLLSLQHFEVHLGSSTLPIVYTDHNRLYFYLKCTTIIND